MTLSEDDLIMAVQEYLDRRGLRATTGVVKSAWTKGETTVVCDVVNNERGTPSLRPFAPPLPGTAEEAGARTLYDLACRIFVPTYPLVPWEELPVETKRVWLREADRLAAARAGRDAT